MSVSLSPGCACFRKPVGANQAEGEVRARPGFCTDDVGSYRAPMIHGGEIQLSLVATQLDKSGICTDEIRSPGFDEVAVSL